MGPVDSGALLPAVVSPELELASWEDPPASTAAVFSVLTRPSSRRSRAMLAPFSRTCRDSSINISISPATRA
jgi:hypothetical protein